MCFFCSRVRYWKPTTKVARCCVECHMWGFMVFWWRSWKTANLERLTAHKELELLHTPPPMVVFMPTFILFSKWTESTWTSALFIPALRCSLHWIRSFYVSLMFSHLNWTQSALSLYRYSALDILLTVSDIIVQGHRSSSSSIRPSKLH